MATMHVLEEAPTKVVSEGDAAQKVERSKKGLGCAQIVLGFTLVSTLIFIMFVYPNYNTSHAWLFWIITVSILLAESFVIYLAIFVTRAVNHEGGKW